MSKASYINEKNRKWWTLATVCFGLLMIVLDGNVVNLALPRIIKDFGASISQIEWINNAYLLTFAIFLITFGRLGDEIGRKKMFAGGLIIFMVGSFLCGIAPSTNALIIFRIIQGLGGAAMMPATLSLIAANFKKEERGGAMGLWGAVAGISIVLGPIIGGYLTDRGLGQHINQLLHIEQYWRYVFYINLPIGILALIATTFIIKESKDRETKHAYDFKGIILSSLSIFTLTYAFIEGAKYGWRKVAEEFKLFGLNIHFGNLSVIPVLFLLAIIFAYIFIRCEKNCGKDPLVDLKLFRSRNFSVGSAAATILSFAMMGSFFLLPLFLQSVLGFSAIETGKNLMPFAITILILSPISGKLADKIGGKVLIILGLTIMAIGGWMLAHFRIDTTMHDLILPFIVMGFGMGLTQAPLTNIALLDTPEDEVGGASGVLSTARQVGSVMGIAILGAVLQTSMSANLNKSLDDIAGLPSNVKNMILESAKSQGMSEDSSNLEEQIKVEMMKNIPSTDMVDNSKLALLPPQQLAQVKAQVAAKQAKLMQRMKETGIAIGTAVKQSFVDSINHTFRIASLIALLGAAVALLFRQNKKSLA